MDPDVLLAEIRESIRLARVAAYNADAGEHFGDAADKFVDLDEWLSRGGFLPAAWAEAQATRYPTGE